jgi:hypothetical protein
MASQHDFIRLVCEEAEAEARQTQGAAPQSPSSTWPAPLGEAAYHGLAGEFVQLTEPHTESDPAALLFQFLTYAGNTFGDKAFFLVEDTRHYPNLFVTLSAPPPVRAKARLENGLAGCFARQRPPGKPNASPAD